MHLNGHHLAAITRRRADGCESNVAFARERLGRPGSKSTAASGCGTRTEWYSDFPLAVPAQVDHSRFLATAFERRRKSGRCGAGLEDEIAIGRRPFRRGKVDAQFARHFCTTRD